MAKAEESQEEARARLAQAESEAQSKEQALAKEIDDARTEALAQAETAEGAGQEAQ